MPTRPSSSRSETRWTATISAWFSTGPRPLLARRDKTTGEPRKMSFGPWMLMAFGALARLKFLRGTALDPFGYTAERKAERQLVCDYETLIDELLAKLSPGNHDVA